MLPGATAMLGGGLKVAAVRASILELELLLVVGGGGNMVVSVVVYIIESGRPLLLCLDVACIASTGSLFTCLSDSMVLLVPFDTSSALRVYGGGGFASIGSPSPRALTELLATAAASLEPTPLTVTGPQS